MQLQGALLAGSSNPTKEYYPVDENFEGELG